MRIDKAFRNRIKTVYLKTRYHNRIVFNAVSGTHLLPKLYVAGEGEIHIGTGLMAEKNTAIESYGSGRINVGARVFMNTNTKIVARENIQIGDYTVIGPNVCIYDHDHDWKSENMQDKYVSAPVHIGSNVWIGANSIILKGVTIGSNSVIAAGSVVKADVPPDSLFYQERHDIIRRKKEHEQKT